ncbi:MAG: hypothetical protein ABI867_43750 [Kofleriaceae bacterium]
MGLPTVHLTLVADTRVARDLSAGGVFVHGCELAVNEQCELVVKTHAGELRLEARVVYIDGRGGAGLELLGFGAAMKTQLAALIISGAPAVDATAGTSEAINDSIDTLDMDMDDLSARPGLGQVNPVHTIDEIDEPTIRRRSAPADEIDQQGHFDLDGVHNFDETVRAPPHESLRDLEVGSDDTVRASHETLGDSERAGDPDNPAPDEGVRESDDEPIGDFLAAGTDEQRKVARSIHERLRGLPLTEQIKKANSSDPSERIMLERIYGKTVWEPLLRNSRLTAPEVSRIARMGALPRPLLEVIVGNGGWIQVPEVRRALLSNPRLGADQILRVLRLMPKHELKLCTTQTVYPYAVRDAAKRLVRG